MFEVLQLLFIKIKYTLFFIRSKFFGFIARNRYKKIKHFCLFVGYPRTGHSLIASLLDAHPNIIMGMEWNVLHFLEHGYKRNQILWAIERNSRNFKDKCNNTWTNYNYKVEGLKQGHSDDIKIIGDKMAGLTTSILIRNPHLLEKLEKEVRSGLKLIHVIRNPFDTITTMTLKIFRKNLSNEEISHLNLLPMIEKFFRYANTINRLKSEKRFEIIDIYHEDIIEDPFNELKRLIEYLGLDADEDYYNNCVKIIYPEPNKSRVKLVWTDEIRVLVDSEIRKIDFLKHYRFDD